VTSAPRAFTAAVLFACSPALAGGPQAHVPLPTPNFSIDLFSPSIGGPNNLRADDVLRKPGPIQAVFGVNMGLGRPGDELDALSGTYPINPTATFTLLFSVDRATVGAVPPDPGLVLAGFPYNVQQQAALNQAAGDLFMATRLFNLGGPLPLAGRAISNNTQVINQGDAGGVDFQLTPDISPEADWQFPYDDVDAVGYLPGGPGRAINNLFFSLDRHSPSLPTLPGGVLNSGGTIFFDPNPNAPGTEQLYVQRFQLGLQFEQDDLDALVLFENGNNVFEPGIDIVMFSLRRDSPSLAVFGRSAADVLVSTGLGNFALFASAHDIGLLPTDELNALELLHCNNIDVCIYDHAIFPEPASALLLLVAGVLLPRGRRSR
jgi:hypothetical protein